jgi:hypothetical protein
MAGSQRVEGARRLAKKSRTGGKAARPPPRRGDDHQGVTHEMTTEPKPVSEDRSPDLGGPGRRNGAGGSVAEPPGAATCAHSGCKSLIPPSAPGKRGPRRKYCDQHNAPKVRKARSRGQGREVVAWGILNGSPLRFRPVTREEFEAARVRCPRRAGKKDKYGNAARCTCSIRTGIVCEREILKHGIRRRQELVRARSDYVETSAAAIHDAANGIVEDWTRRVPLAQVARVSWNRDPSDDEWCEAHGIDPELWPAWRYGTDDVERVQEAFRDHLTKGQLSTVARIVRRSPGWLMPKHGLPLYPDGVIPQLRPDRAVLVDSRKRWHFHGSLRNGWPVFPSEAGKRAGKHLPKAIVLTGDAALLHIDRATGAQHDPLTGLGSHHGANQEGVHFHLDEAKYVLLGEGQCQRLDLPPEAAAMLASARRVFFVLEGSLKTYAILSAGEAVFGVPSVTLWDSEELARWIEVLQAVNPNMFVYVVPDADWFLKPAVDRQALFVRSVIRNAGLPAEIVAPPVFQGQKQCECKPVDLTRDGRSCSLCGGFLKGVDDYLGAGGTIDGLIVRGKEAPLGQIARWGRTLVAGLRSDRAARAARAIEQLSLHADKAGRFHQPSIWTLARIVKQPRKERLVQTIKDLSDVVSVVDGSLEIAPVEYQSGYQKGQPILNQFGRPVLDWVAPPTLEIKLEFRAAEASHHTISEYEEEQGTVTTAALIRQHMDAHNDAISRLLDTQNEILRQAVAAIGQVAWLAFRMTGNADIGNRIVDELVQSAADGDS